MNIRIKSSSRLLMNRPVNAISAKYSYAAKQGVDLSSVLSEIGLTETDLEDPDLFVTIDQEFSFLSKFLKKINDPMLGIEVAKHHHLAALGKWAIAVLYSSTGLEAFKVAFKFSDISNTTLQYELTASGESATVRCRELMDLGDCRKFIHQHEIFVVYQLYCLVIEKPLKLNELRFAFPEPENPDEYQEVFQCPVYFDAESTSISFDSSYLKETLPRANPLLRKSYEKESEKFLKHIRSLESTATRVNWELSCFEEGLLPTIEYIAGRLHMSSRTLKRRLNAEATSYKSLLEDFRKKKAVNLLQTTNLSLEEISLKIGYSDAPGFCHAFKRWTGFRPSHYRNAIQE